MLDIAGTRLALFLLARDGEGAVTDSHRWHNLKYETDVKVTKDDKILTLVTCSYEFKNARLVIHAKRV
ncbi:hypothetical protein SSCH_810047 [Syntrophaceticus schinkii]|uniref:Sortase n=1 Tax=Syntrophaceticus schinkii TaxID=499207 RepID=A0A0B7MK08_9FIRM|nr:hypothetical protein SSCH_810047 [Syntrophaceticus schinkii]